MNPAIFFLMVVVAMATCALLVVAIVKRCYLVAPSGTAIVKTGLGPDMVSMRGMLIYPVINQVQFVSLEWQEVKIEFGNPLRFADGEAKFDATVWVSQREQDDLIIAAAQNFGERCSNPQFLCDLYRDSLRQAIEKIAKSANLAQWKDDTLSVSVDLKLALNDTLEKFHITQRVCISYRKT